MRYADGRWMSSARADHGPVLQIAKILPHADHASGRQAGA
jgi:hypothetical protein